MAKWIAKKTTVDGIEFDSKAEAERYGELTLLQRAGRIRNLTVHVGYPLKVNGIVVCSYEADFVYESPTTIGSGGVMWCTIVEDVKSPMSKTPVYELKKKLMRAVYGIEILETSRAKSRKNPAIIKGWRKPKPPKTGAKAAKKK